MDPLIFAEDSTIDRCQMNGLINVIQRYCYFLAYLLKTAELTHQRETQEALHFLQFTF